MDDTTKPKMYKHKCNPNENNKTQVTWDPSNLNNDCHICGNTLEVITTQSNLGNRGVIEIIKMIDVLSDSRWKKIDLPPWFISVILVGLCWSSF
jgi:ribosomal protein S27E